MTSVLLDTHAWSLAGDARLSLTARTAIADADTVMISPITFFEIAQEVDSANGPGCPLSSTSC